MNMNGLESFLEFQEAGRGVETLSSILLSYDGTQIRYC